MYLRHLPPRSLVPPACSSGTARTLVVNGFNAGWRCARAAVFLFEAFGDTNAHHYLPDMSSCAWHLITVLADVFGVKICQSASQDEHEHNKSAASPRPSQQRHHAMAIFCMKTPRTWGLRMRTTGIHQTETGRRLQFFWSDIGPGTDCFLGIGNNEPSP